MPLNASLDAALKGAAPLPCLLLRIALPDHVIRVVDGAGEVAFASETYRGEDATYGVLSVIEGFAESIGTEAPKVRFAFLPATLPALADITDPANQGAAVRLWLGAINPATGLLIGDPELLFLGELDTADFDADDGKTVVTFDAASAWERLFDQNEGSRINNTFMQWLRPGQRGFEYITVIQREEPWGYDGPRPNVVADTNSGTAGGGSSGGGGGGSRGGAGEVVQWF